MKILILLLLPVLAMGATRTLDPNGGGEYTALSSVVTASDVGDTIQCVNGPWKITNSASQNWKSNLFIYSENYDTIEGVNCNVIYQTYNGLHMKGLCVKWDTTQHTAGHYIVLTKNSDGHVFEDCIFIRSCPSVYTYGNSHTDSTKQGVVYKRCQFKNTGIYTSTPSANVRNMVIDSCLFLDSLGLSLTRGTARGVNRGVWR